MEVLYILIPIAIILVLIMAGLFIWAIQTNQFEDIERHGNDIIFDDDDDVVSKQEDSQK